MESIAVLPDRQFQVMKLQRRLYRAIFVAVISEESLFFSISYAHLLHTHYIFSHFIAWLTVFIQLILKVPIEFLVSVKVTLFWYVMPNVSEELAASNFSLASSYPQMELSS